MFPRSFDYFSPSNVTEALDLLKDGGLGTRILAGGQSLIPLMKLRGLALKTVVDINGIKELNYIRIGKDSILIGALTTLGTLENDLELAALQPILRETALQIADPLVRNLGTVGGDLCYADPANDLPAVMIALNASFVMTSQNGTRKIQASNFFLDAYKSALSPGEVLTEIQIPLLDERVGSSYHKIRKGSGGFTIAGVAANVMVDESNAISGCKIALTAVGPKPLRPKEAEEALIGKTLDASVLETASRLTVNSSSPTSDLNASAEYRRKALVLLLKDAVQEAYRRAVIGKYEKN